MNKQMKAKLEKELEEKSHPLDRLYKEVVKLSSEVKSVQIYAEEMHRYTKDLQNKLEIFKNTLKEMMKK